MRAVFIQDASTSWPEEAWDLRGAEEREVRCDDVVVISGTEYLRKTRLASAAGAALPDRATLEPGC